MMQRDWMSGRGFRSLLKLPLLGAVTLTAACASIDGMPPPVLDPEGAVTLARGYGIDKALAAIAKEPDPRAYRNKVIAIHMAAADFRYLGFRNSLARQYKGSNLALDIGILGLTGAGAVAAGAANELSAAAAGLTGTRSTLNKDLYFERTLPALIASMDASRLRLKSEIVKKLSQPVEAYPLEQAFMDLIAYQMAASIETAIQGITVNAAEEAAKEEAEYKNVTIAFASCKVDDTTGDLWGRINAGLRAVKASGDQPLLENVGQVMGLTPVEAADPAAVIRRLNAQFCSPTTAGALIDTIESKTGRKF